MYVYEQVEFSADTHPRRFYTIENNPMVNSLKAVVSVTRPFVVRLICVRK